MTHMQLVFTMSLLTALYQLAIAFEMDPNESSFQRIEVGEEHDIALSTVGEYQMVNLFGINLYLAAKAKGASPVNTTSFYPLRERDFQILCYHVAKS
jgi:hypothetical protein